MYRVCIQTHIPNHYVTTRYRSTLGIGIWQDWPAPTGYYHEPGQWEINSVVRQSLGDLTSASLRGGNAMAQIGL